MKLNILLAALVLLTFYITCKSLRKTDTPVAAVVVDTIADYSKSGYNFNAAHVIHGSNPDSAPPYQIKAAPARVKVPWDKIPPPSTSRRSFLATGWWKPKMAFMGSDTAVHTHYLGKFLKFREDQTFDLLEGGKVLETGHWGFEEEKKILYMACRDTYFNNSWKIQENGFRMVWIGNTDINFTGIQVRFDGSNTLPEGQ